MNDIKLKILCLEDVLEDALLIREFLRSEGLLFQFDHVSTENDFVNGLRTGSYDIILSDYGLPGFSGIAALMLSVKMCPDVPFICISGSIEEKIAVELIYLGAADYIYKDNLSKLPASIEKALREAEALKARRTAEISLKESEARFRDIIMSSNDWVWELDSEWRYIYASDKIESILGFTPDEVIGKTPMDLMPVDERERIGKAFLDCVRTKSQVKDLENWNVHKDGRLVCLQTNGYPILDNQGNLTGYRGVDKDITERKKLYSDLIAAKEKAEQSDRLKTAFMNNISHEVRTPLNGIIGFAELILQNGIKPEEKDFYKEILNESSERLLATINNYMDISLLLSGNMKLNLKRVNIEEIINRCYEKFLPKCKNKGLLLSKDILTEADMALTTDDVLLEKSISHILDNAVKFTNSGTITIGLRSNNNMAEIFIRDTGPGISPENMNNIFMEFTQKEMSLSREHEGSGLGLSIARGCIELIGGNLRLESEKGKGSTFIIDLPSGAGLSKQRLLQYQL